MRPVIRTDDFISEIHNIQYAHTGGSRSVLKLTGNRFAREAYFTAAGSTTGGEASQLKGFTGIFRTTPSAIKITAIQISG